MDARCPVCTSVFQTDKTGVQFCPNCGSQVNVADTTGAGASGGGTYGAGGPSGGAGFGGTGPRFGEPGAGGPNFGGPTGGVPPPGGRGPTPWERRGEIGFFAGLFGTLKDAMLSPTEFFGRAKTSEPVWDAIAFSWLITVLYALMALPLNLAGAGKQYLKWYQQLLEQMPNLPPAYREAIRRAQEEAAHQGVGKALLNTVLAIIVTAAVILLWAVITHLFAMMFGAAKNGIGATIRATTYAWAPMILGAIPCINVLAMIYTVVLTIIGLSKLQETDGGRATAAVLVPALVFCCCCCVGAVMAGMALASGANAMMK